MYQPYVAAPNNVHTFRSTGLLICPRNGIWTAAGQAEAAHQAREWLGRQLKAIIDTYTKEYGQPPPNETYTDSLEIDADRIVAQIRYCLTAVGPETLDD